MISMQSCCNWTLQIKTHDGVMRTLTNVRHIPDVKHNLILVGTLESP